MNINVFCLGEPSEDTLHLEPILLKNGLTLIILRISNHMPSKVWDDITYPFPNFNDAWSLGMDK